MKSPSSVTQTDLSSDNLLARDLFNSVSFTLRGKQQELEDLNNELEALTYQSVIDEDEHMARLNHDLEGYDEALYKEELETAILLHVKKRTKTGLVFCKQKSEQLTYVVDDWTRNIEQGNEHLGLAEKCMEEESNKLQLCQQLLTDSREMYSDKLVARGNEVRAIIEDNKFTARTQSIHNAEREYKQGLVRKLKLRLEERKKRLIELDVEKKLVQNLLKDEEKRFKKLSEAMQTKNTLEIIDKFSQTTFQNESLKRRLIMMNDDHKQLFEDFLRSTTELTETKLPITAQALHKRLKRKRELIFKQPAKKLRTLKTKTEINLNYKNSAECLLSSLHEALSHFLRKFDAVDKFGLLGPNVELSTDIWSSAVEMGLVFGRKVLAAKVIVEQSKKAKRYQKWKFAIQPTSVKVSIMEKFTDAFLETFSGGVTATSLNDIKHRMYTTHFLEVKPDKSDYSKLKRMESIITGAADLELKAVKTPTSKRLEISTELFTTQEPLLKTFQASVKESLKSPKAKKSHVMSSITDLAAPKKKFGRMSMHQSMKELRAVTSSLKVKNRSWLKTQGTSLTDLYQETKKKRKHLGLDTSTGISLKIRRQSYNATTIGSEDTSSVDLPSIRGLKRSTFR
mmetsp:Transcript_21549/g.39409  ORF Transcript_21549/g.39409 Transcript_21549/m.39409 type:complete len:624 (-) Transcript_21549:57-1928(-)